MTRYEKIYEQVKQACLKTIGEKSYSYESGAYECHIKRLCEELDGFKAPQAGPGAHSATYPTTEGELVVHYEFEKGQAQTWDDPGYEDTVTVTSVYARGQEITDLVSDSMITAIEEYILATRGE